MPNPSPTRAELRAADLGLARQRLMSRIDSCGYDSSICKKTADICEQMGDLTEAGRWYFLSNIPEDDAAGHVLIEYFLHSCRHEKSYVLSRLPRAFKRIVFEDLPVPVQHRLATIGIHSLGLTPTQQARRAHDRCRLKSRIAGVGCVVLVVLIGIVFLVGLGSVLTALVDIFKP